MDSVGRPSGRRTIGPRCARGYGFLGALLALSYATSAEAQLSSGVVVQIRQGTSCLTAPAEAGDAVTVTTCDMSGSDAAQAFFAQEVEAGVYQFVGPAGARLDIFGGSADPGANVTTWSATGGANQEFQVEGVAGGSRLRPQHSAALCIERSGANAVTSTCSAAGGQVWTFSPVSQPGGIRDCSTAELYKPYFVENDEGGPRGANVSIITNGLMMVIFTPDSGQPPGVIHFYDVTDPRAPILRHRVDNDHTKEIREAHALPVAYYGDKEYVAIQTIKGIQFWDLTNPLEATYVTQLDLPGVTGGDYDNVSWQSDWQGRYLYVSGSNQGIYVIDTIDIENPVLLAQVPNGMTGGFRVGPLFARGPYLTIGNMDQDGAFAVLDVSVPQNPALLATRSDLPRLYTILATGDRIIGAGRDGDLTIHSFSDPTLIEEVSTTRIEQDSLYVASQDHFIFSGRQNNFVKIDVTDETDPQIVGEGALGRGNPDHGQVTPIGNWLFVGNDHGTGSGFFCHAETDDLPPKATWVYPPDGAEGLDPTTRVTVSFSDYLETRDLRNGGFSVRALGGESVDGILTYNFNTVGFTPTVPFEDNTSFEIVLSGDGLHDAMGNPVGEETVYTFGIGDPPDVPLGTGGTESGEGPIGSAGGDSDADDGGGMTDGDEVGAPGDDPGCSCRAAGGTETTRSSLSLFLLLGLAGFAGQRRRAGQRRLRRKPGY